MDDFKSIALLLTILLPAGAGTLLVFMPRNRTMAIKCLAVLAGALTLALTIVIFAMYDYGEGGYQFVNAWRWLDDPMNIDFSIGIDGISAPMVLLTGIVMFAGVLVSWNVAPRSKDFFILFMFLVAGSLRRLRCARPLLPVLLLRVGGAADVPPHRRLGKQHRLRKLPSHQGVRGHEADPVPGGGERVGLDRHYRPLRGRLADFLGDTGFGSGRSSPSSFWTRFRRTEPSAGTSSCYSSHSSW